ncbi:MAG: hypothetical protein COA90_00960 [Gammaproteobacteria bacterium]|nr:MAG: hypothetical protein COA90_00960 [Gammaproteobacteria bacterium]
MIKDTDGLAPKLYAQMLFFQGYYPKEIADITGTPLNTVNSWTRRGKWKDAGIIKRAALMTEVRYCQMLFKQHKTDGDLAEIEQLYKTIEKADRRLYSNTAPKSGQRKRNNKKNYFSPKEIEVLKSAFFERLFTHQETWWDARHNKVRQTLKSRQIGATDYFGIEAFMKGLLKTEMDERGSAFISASKAQAFQFKEYIVGFVQQVLDREIKGDPLIYTTDVGRNKLDFLGTNARTAQGRPAHTYIDEYFWIQRFRSLREVSIAMATQKFYQATFFSTTSTLTHEAYEWWSGEWYNQGRNINDHISIDISHEILKTGKVCEDGHWRQIVTFDDAVESGFNLFDPDHIKLMNSPDIIEQLYNCKFIDDINSPFPLTQTTACGVDCWIEWDDFFEPFAVKPVANLPVWVGYDPSLVGDFGKVVVILLPLKHGDKYRLIEKLHFDGADFTEQAAAIKALTQKYNVQRISVDRNGLGEGVFGEIKKFFRRVEAVDYSPDNKAVMVTKLQYLLGRNLFEYDAGDIETPQSLAAIERSLTDAGRKITYKAGRNKDIGHADTAWALLNAFNPLQLDQLNVSNDEQSRSGGTRIY